MNGLIHDLGLKESLALLEEARDLTEEAARKRALATSKVFESAKMYIDKGVSTQDKMILASHLYWNIVEVTPSMICKIFGIKHIKKKGYELITSNPPIRDLPCIGCENTVRVMVNSRTHLEEISNGGGSKFCESCVKNQSLEWENTKKEALDMLVKSPIIRIAQANKLHKVSKLDLVREGCKIVLVAGGSFPKYQMEESLYHRVLDLNKMAQLHNFEPNDYERMIVEDELRKIGRLICH